MRVKGERKVKDDAQISEQLDGCSCHLLKYKRLEMGQVF